MAGSVKGITIEFRGDTTKLDSALRQINTETRNLDKELKNVDKALKFNPTNVELWKQKQELLTKKVNETKEKLDVLKQAQAKMDASGVDKNSEEYRKLQREIIETQSKVKTFEGQLKKIGNVNLKALSEQVKEVGSKLEYAGEKMKALSKAGAAAATAVGALAVKGGKAADDLNTLSKVTGIGTKDLQKYSAAADLVDVSVESIASANKKLTKNAYAAANGSKSQAAAFDKLGISVTDADGNLKDSETIFQEVIAGLGKMTNETERDAVAQKLMGGAAAELNPLIADGGETYKQVADIIAKYDLDFVDQKTLDGANQFNDELDTMKVLAKTALSQVSTQLASYLAPALEKVVGWVGKLAQWLGNLDPKLLTIIAGIGAALAVIAPLLIGLGKIATGISAIINLVGVLGPAIGGLSIAGGPLLLVVAAIAAVVAAGVLLYKNWDTIKEKAASLYTSLKTKWENIRIAISNAVEAAKTAVSNAWESIKTKTKNAWQSITNAITAPFKSAIDYVKKVVKWFKDLFPINLKNLFNIKLPHFGWDWTEVGDTGLYLPNLKIEWWKKGGIFTKPTLLGGGNGVGEAGAEAVLPLQKLWEEMDKRFNTNDEITINVYASDGMDVNELALKVEQRLVQLQKQRTKAYGGI